MRGEPCGLHLRGRFQGCVRQTSRHLSRAGNPGGLFTQSTPLRTLRQQAVIAITRIPPVPPSSFLANAIQRPAAPLHFAHFFLRQPHTRRFPPPFSLALRRDPCGKIIVAAAKTPASAAAETSRRTAPPKWPKKGLVCLPTAATPIFPYSLAGASGLSGREGEAICARKIGARVTGEAPAPPEFPSLSPLSFQGDQSRPETHPQFEWSACAVEGGHFLIHGVDVVGDEIVVERSRSPRRAARAHNLVAVLRHAHFACDWIYIQY